MSNTLDVSFVRYTPYNIPSPPPSMAAKRALAGWYFRYAFNPLFVEAVKNKNGEIAISEEEIHRFMAEFGLIDKFNYVPDKNSSQAEFEQFRTRVHSVRSAMNKATRVGNHVAMPPYSVDFVDGKYYIRVIKSLAKNRGQEMLKRSETFLTNQYKRILQELEAWTQPDVLNLLPTELQMKVRLQVKTHERTKNLLKLMVEDSIAEVTEITELTERFIHREELPAPREE